MINKEKYIELLIYIIDFIKANKLGKTKLYKILFFIDFESFNKLGHKITNDTYLRYPMGPVPENAWTIISELQKGGSISIEREISGDNNKFMYIFRALRKPRMDVFTSEESVIISRIVAEKSPKSKNELVEESHKGPWSKVEDWKEVIFTKDTLSSGQKISQTGNIVKDITSQYSEDIKTLSNE